MKISKRVKFGRNQLPVHGNLSKVASIEATFSRNLDHTGISKSLRFMAQNYSRPIQLGDVAKVSGMSRRGFLKAFNQHVGCTPGALMRQARIEFAKRLLTEQDFSLKTIAALTGFSSENTFCIAFTRATGLAPKRFQRQAWLSVFNYVSKLQK